MKCIVERNSLRPRLLQAVEHLSGQDVKECYQCGKCTAGCPIAADMDMPPNQVIRLLQLGLVERAFNSSTAWLCASCETCTTRCPREVDLAAVMDAVRNVALREGIRPPERAVSFFNRVFLSIIKRYGRVFEMELIGTFNTGTFNFFKDVTKAPKLLLKGRLKFWPSLAGRDTCASVFKDVKKLRSLSSADSAAAEPGPSTEHAEHAGD